MVATLANRNEAFELAVEGLLALHRLVKEGRDDSEEAESIRDSLDASLGALTAAEHERARWLSEDLYSLSEGEWTVEASNPQFQRGIKDIVEARQSRDWDRALTLLRRWRKYFDSAQVSYMRGSIWHGVGYPRVAATFYGHASDVDPKNANYRFVYLHVLKKTDPEGARILARKVLSEEEGQAAAVIVQAAHARLMEARSQSKQDSQEIYEELIPVLERCVAKFRPNDNAPDEVLDRVLAIILLGWCYASIGRKEEAYSCYTRGLQESPDNEGLLIARGILQYGTDPGAISDFEQALRNGSSVIWPYLYLAKHALNNHQFRKCLDICNMGMAKIGPDAAKGRLEDWRGICLAELGHSVEEIRAAFKRAIELDGSNQFAKHNLKVVEESGGISGSDLTSSWSQAPEAEVRDYGMAEELLAIA